MTDRIVQFFVAGIPKAQGSMRGFVVKGRAVVTHDKSRELNDWRGDIRTEAQKAVTEAATGAVCVNLMFRLPRVQSLPKRREIAHTKKPDIDRLLRAGLDAMTGVVFADDAQVNAVSVSKRYALDGEQTGVMVTVQWEVAAQATLRDGAA